MLTKTPAIVAIMLCSGLVSASASDQQRVSAVLELFTSQGCASCPPADELLEKYAGRPDIVALSYSVDYWDYRGWKDTLAAHEFTERQKAYAAVHGDRQVYTPQLVVNGRRHVVGSDEGAVAAAIEKGPKPSVPIDVDMMGDAISVSVGKAEGKQKATLWLAVYDRHVAVPVERGENRNRTLDYYNVVRKLRPIAIWRGEPIKVDLPMADYRESNADGCAVLLQEEAEGGAPGPIVGAARIDSADGKW